MKKSLNERDDDYFRGVNCGCFLGVLASVLAACLVTGLIWATAQ